MPQEFSGAGHCIGQRVASTMAGGEQLSRGPDLWSLCPTALGSGRIGTRPAAAPADRPGRRAPVGLSHVLSSNGSRRVPCGRVRRLVAPARAAITLNKLRHQAERHRAARRTVTAEVDLQGNSQPIQLATRDATPEDAVLLLEELESPSSRVGSRRDGHAPVVSRGLLACGNRGGNRRLAVDRASRP